MNYIVPLLFPDNEMPAGRLRHWAELWREADITSEPVSYTHLTLPTKLEV